MPKAKLSSLSIAFKLPAMIVASAIVLALSLSISAYLSAAAEERRQIGIRFQSILEGSSKAVSSYLKTIEEDLNIVTNDPATAEALDAFTNAYRVMPAAEANLKRLYIEENPNPLGEKHKLDAAPDGSSYSAAHAQYHGRFRTLLETRDYYDIFLFDRLGNLVYSVFKESDFATNFFDGEWAQTDLGNVFRAAIEAKDPKFIAFEDFEPYAPSADAPASFIAQPIFRDGQAIGVLAFQMPINRINGLMNGVIGLGKTGEAMIVGQDRLMRNDSRFSEASDILSTLVDSPVIDTAFDGAMSDGVLTGYRDDSFLAMAKPLTYRGAEWAIVVMEAESEIYAPMVAMRNEMALIGMGLLLAVALGGYRFARSITGPMAKLNDTMRQLADGETDVDLSDSKRGDEIGRMSRAVEVFRDNAVERMRLEAQSAEESSRNQARQARIEEVITAFREEVGTIMQSVSGATMQLESTAQALTGIADDTNHKVTTVAGASEEASANVQTVAAATEELASSISEIDRQVGQTDVVVKQAAQHAGSTNEQVQRLADTAQKIGDVIGLIQDIAEQTNLLALNATIEAARAGEMGKGFAVVASEVKSLANQTARATDEISDQINTIQTDTRAAAEAIAAISDTMQEVDSFTATIAAAVREQGGATNEISRNVQEAATGTQSVSETIAGVANSANETSQSAGQLAMTVNDLSQVTDRLNGSVEKFLEEVAAA